MLNIQQNRPVIAPVVVAGLLLAARTLAGEHDLPSPSATDIIRVTGASRSRAHELKNELLGLLPGLVRPVGRPRKPEVPAAQHAEQRLEVAGEVVRFLVEHPGSMVRRAKQTNYADCFRCFILELRERYAELDLHTFSAATQIPVGTLGDWLRPGAPHKSQSRASNDAAPREPTVARVEMVLAAWQSWRGGFTSFCEHVRRDLRMEYGNTALATLLFEHGARTPKRRRGRSPDEEALRGQFETFFGGAQWVGDGKQLTAAINGEPHAYTLELFVDAFSGAWVGLDVRDQEDSEAVANAFAAGVQTTGAPPLAALLDNKPSNHTAEVDEALGDTMRIRATPERPQNKAHVEGAFGLFSQTLPPVDLSTHDPHELGRNVLFLLAWVFAVALNHRPRRLRDRPSRVDLYREPVTDDEREAARQRLEKRLHKQEAARRSRHARLDPALRAFLDDAFDRLGLDDPERHFRNAIALHRREDIVDAIATFDGKSRAGTLPEHADARYLLGILKNIRHVHENTQITEALIELRLAARDHFLEPLVTRRDALRSSSERVEVYLRAAVDALADAQRELDRRFWTMAIADALSEQPPSQQPRLFRSVARRIHASFRMNWHDRAAATLRIARRLWPNA